MRFILNPVSFQATYGMSIQDALADVVTFEPPSYSEDHLQARPDDYCTITMLRRAKGCGVEVVGTPVWTECVNTLSQRLEQLMDEFSVGMEQETEDDVEFRLRKVIITIEDLHKVDAFVTMGQLQQCREQVRGLRERVDLLQDSRHKIELKKSCARLLHQLDVLNEQVVAGRPRKLSQVPAVENMGRESKNEETHPYAARGNTEEKDDQDSQQFTEEKYEDDHITPEGNSNTTHGYDFLRPFSSST